MRQQNMKILYLVDHWPGLFEAYLFREIEWMKGRGHGVAVASLCTGGAHGFRSESTRYVDLSQFSLDNIPVLQLESRGMSNDQVVRELVEFARQQGSEIIDAHHAREPAEVACDIHLASGLPFAVRMRGGD